MEIWTFSFQSAFGINFGLREVVKRKYTNTRICVFLVPEVQIDSES